MAGTGTEDEIRVVLEQVLEAQNAGDAERVRSMLSERPGAVHIGTDGEEWWTSKQVADAVAASLGTGDIRAVADDVDVHVHGDVARFHRRAKHRDLRLAPGRLRSLLFGCPAPEE
jgi:hypothetical protein